MSGNNKSADQPLENRRTICGNWRDYYGDEWVSGCEQQATAAFEDHQTN